MSTIIGPLLGGFFVDNLSWRWIFYVNVPIGAVALFVIGAVFHSRTERVEHSIDYVGAATLAGGLSCVVLFTSLGGTTFAWDSTQIALLIVLSVVLLVAFCFAERAPPEPILPLELFRNRIFAVTSIIGFVIGLALFGSVTYLPIFLQIVKGESPTASGLLLTPMMAGPPDHVDRERAPDLQVRPLPPVPDRRHRDHDRRHVPALAARHRHRPVYTRARDGVLGLGLGMVMQVLVLAVQNAVDYRNMGVATSGSLLFRQIGGSIGIALFGAIFTNGLRTQLADRLPPHARSRRP